MPDIDKQIIAVLQDDFEVCERPYKLLAEKLGITESEILIRITRLKENGQLRKMGAVLKHREIGFTSNALCGWNVPKERLNEVGKVLAQHPQITHCYSRDPQSGWPYSLYTMIHAVNDKECRQIAQDLAAKVSIAEFILLFSTHEWKKSTMRYI